MLLQMEYCGLSAFGRSVTIVSPAKRAEPIKMLFGLQLIWVESIWQMYFNAVMCLFTLALGALKEACIRQVVHMLC